MKVLPEETISVVIPTWNRAGWVERAIRSALSQTYPVLEVLVCDDGSDDGTREVVKKIEDERVVWCGGEHSGHPSVPRNRGIAKARGDWVAFLDSDDEWFPFKLEKQLSWAKERGVPAVCSNAVKVDREYRGEEPLLPDVPETITLDLLLRENVVVCSSMVVRRDLLLEVGGFPEDPETAGFEDYILWTFISTVTPIGGVREPLLKYLFDPGGGMSPRTPPYWEMRRIYLKTLLTWASGRPGRGIVFTKAVPHYLNALFQVSYRKLRRGRDSS